LKKSKSLIYILSLLFLFSCSSRDNKNNYPVKIETIDGIKVISNPSFPKYNNITYNIEEELSIGLVEGDSNYTFNYVSAIRVAENGTIFVLDGGDYHIQAYSKNGKYLRTISRKGQGPGEILGCRFDLSSDGKIYIMDLQNARITILDTSGVYLSDFNILNLNAHHHFLYSDQKNYIYFSKEFLQNNKYMMSIHRHAPDGSEIINYGNFMADQIVMFKIDGKTRPIRSSTTPTTVWAISDTGLLYTGFSDDYQITVYNSSGKPFFKFSREYSPLKSTKWRKFSDSEYIPAFSRTWLMDEQGDLWIELFNPENFDVIIYDIFSPDGIYLKQVLLPHRISEFKGGKAYCVVYTEEKIPLVKRFKLIEVERVN